MDDCILWPQSCGSHGYGQTYHNGKVTLAHRVAWEKVHGPIPAALTIDHMCRNRRCVNVNHLRLLTRSENASDNAQKRRTHCPAGHPYDEGNTYRNQKGHRRCRTCYLAQRIARRQKKAA